MEIDITLKNYRCFPDSLPARFRLGEGFTALVGVNNSGKSSLLKFFYEFRNLFVSLGAGGNLINYLRQEQNVSFQGVNETAEVFSNRNDRPLEIEIRPSNFSTAEGIEAGIVVEALTLRIDRRPVVQTSLRINGKDVKLENNVQYLGGGGDILGYISQQTGAQTPAAYVRHVTDSIQLLSRAMYIPAFRNVINVGTNAMYFDIQAGQAFVENWRALKTGPNKLTNEATLRLTGDIRRIFQFEYFEINSAPDSQTLQVFVNNSSYRLSELGSGIAQFILVLANVATRRPTYVLLDEPELNLHPSLQLDLLTTLASYSSQGTCFATHSYGLARATGDPIYTIRRVRDGESEVKPLGATTRLSEFLGEMGFSGYKELGFDKVLLVEGSTDVKTLQSLLRHYNKEHSVLLLSLGGGQLIKDSSEEELLEITRISTNVHALIDSERLSPGEPLLAQIQAFVDTCEALGIPCHVLHRRAIENYLTERAIRKTKGPKYVALQPHQRLADISPAWSKAESWRIAREMTRDELAGTDLGDFLEAL